MVGQQHIQATQTGLLCMLASIKKWVNTHYGMLAGSGETSQTVVVYAILQALNASPANKCQHKFQPGPSPSCEDALPKEFFNRHKSLLFC